MRMVLLTVEALPKIRLQLLVASVCFTLADTALAIQVLPLLK
jgi:hypothetical protein